MDFNMTDFEDVGSPFYFFPQPPDPIHDLSSDLHSPLSTDLQSSLSSDISSHEIELTDLNPVQHWEQEHQFSFTEDLGIYNSPPFSEHSSQPSSSENFSESLNGSHQYDETSSKELSTVASKLKNVIRSRQRLRDQNNCNGNENGGCGGRNNSQRPCSNGCMHASLRFPPCLVCGGNASGLHYGVNTCEPCKGFFTRYLKSKNKKEYTQCNKSGKCVITSRLRANCSACRLKKCLELNMSRQKSKLGRYSLTRRMETIMTVKTLERKQQSEEKHPHNNGKTKLTSSKRSYFVSSAIEDSFVTDKRHNGFSVNVKSPNGFSEKLVRSLVEFMDKIKPYGEKLDSLEQIIDKLYKHYDAYQLKIQVFGNLKTIPKDEYFNLLKVHGIEIDHRMMYLKQSANEIVHVIERYCNFAKQIPHFSQLTNKDQSNLLKSSRYDFFMILMHEGYLHDKKVFLAHNGVAFHQEEVADKFFSRQLVMTVCDMYHRLQKLKLSPKEKALLIAISLLFTDRCTLDNPEIIEKIQFCLVQLLRNQLEKTCKTSAFRRFTQIINCLTVMRDSSELYLKEYNQLCKDEDVIEEVPIMTEMLFDH